MKTAYPAKVSRGHTKAATRRSALSAANIVMNGFQTIDSARMPARMMMPTRYCTAKVRLEVGGVSRASESSTDWSFLDALSGRLDSGQGVYAAKYCQEWSMRTREYCATPVTQLQDSSGTADERPYPSLQRACWSAKRWRCHSRRRSQRTGVS